MDTVNSTQAQAIVAVSQAIAQPSLSETEFNDLALRLFAHQYTHNAALRRFAQARGRTPRTVRRWQDIPAVPIQAFKDCTLSCVPTEGCARVFMTSGTTRGEVRGRHFHPTLQVYDASMRRHFEQRFMKGVPALRMGILFPPETLMPHSSLAHYLQLALAHHGSAGSDTYIDAQGLRVDALCAALADTQQRGEPIALLGASYSFVHLLDALQARGLRFRMPEGSRILDTGGFKGQSREVPMESFYTELCDRFGVPRAHCINMYGMTELSSQFYDAGNAVLPSVKRAPHWMRTRVVDPLSGDDVPAGERGVLVHTDLANFNSTLSILTEDVGQVRDDGFVLLGRAQGAHAQGCSMAVDQFLAAARA